MNARVIIQMCFIMAEIMCQGVRSNQDDCRTSNSTCCYNYYFDKGTGRCVECKLGTFGSNCKESCVGGFYGYLCQKECDCEAHHCDPVTGCTNSVHEFPIEDLSLVDSTTQPIRQESGAIEPVEKFHTTPSVTRGGIWGSPLFTLGAGLTLVVPMTSFGLILVWYQRRRDRMRT